MAEENLGLMSTCKACGGKNQRTGRKVTGPLTPPAFGTGPGYRIVSVEYRCTSCNRIEMSKERVDESGS